MVVEILCLSLKHSPKRYRGKC